jgi:hypothetical protein
MLDRLEGGALAVELPDGARLRAGRGALVAHLGVRDHAVFDVNRPRFFWTRIWGKTCQEKGAGNAEEEGCRWGCAGRAGRSA